jgi:SNF2-related domain
MRCGFVHVDVYCVQSGSSMRGCHRPAFHCALSVCRRRCFGLYLPRAMHLGPASTRVDAAVTSLPPYAPPPLAPLSPCEPTDESHMLKSADAQRTKCALPLLRGARRAMCLSGTPVLSRPAEVFTTLSALLPEVFAEKDFMAFAERYCGARQVSRAGRAAVGGDGAVGVARGGKSTAVLLCARYWRGRYEASAKGCADDRRHSALPQFRTCALPCTIVTLRTCASAPLPPWSPRQSRPPLPLTHSCALPPLSAPHTRGRWGWT